MPRRRRTLAVAATIALGLLAPVAEAREITTYPGVANAWGVAVAPNGTAYVGSAPAGSATGPVATLVGDTFTANAIPIVNTDTFVLAVEPSGIRAFVTGDNGTNATVTSILTATNAVAATYTLGATAIGPNAIAVTRDGQRLMVAATNANAVLAQPIDSGATPPTTIPVGSNPAGIAIHPVNGRVYVTNSGSGTISIIDPQTLTVTGTINGLIQPYGIAFTPDGTRAYVADVTSGLSDELVAIDPATNQIVGRAAIGTATLPRYVAVSPDGARIYATEEASDSVAVFDASPLAYRERIQLATGSAPYDLALNADGTKLYVTLNQTGEVARIQVAPKAPTGLSATNITSSGATIAFTSPDDNGAPITAFQYSVDGGAWTSPAYPTATSPIVIDSLYSATPYTVRVRTLNAQGPGEASAPVAFTTKITNRFSVGKIAVKVQRARIVLTTTVRLPGPGTVRQVATTGKGGKTVRRCSTKGATTTGGPITLTCRIGAAGRKDLKQAALRLKVATTYKPTGGKARTIDRKVRVKRKR